ncbi:MAG TPA: chaperone modulator CbpM [Kribbella sp.]|nr:chaperone modulator CbpM [Kribbella sp.]
MNTALARPFVLDLDAFARLAGVHPYLVVRLVALGLLEPARTAGGQLWFDYADLAALARIQRLRAAFSLNYAALGLVIDLLDRIEAQQAVMAPVRRGSPGVRSWT